MGLNNRGSASNKTFMNIYQGNIVLEYNDQDGLEQKLDSLGLPYNEGEDASDKPKLDTVCVRQRTKGKNEGKDVFYYILRDVGGYLTNVILNENDYGEFLELEFTDVDEKFSVSLGDVYSRMAKDFIRRMGGLDLSEEVIFGVWSISAEKADNGKAKSGVRMYQNDEKLEYHIEYDELPEPTTKKKGRKTVWDFTEQENFLYNALIDWKDENFSSTEVEDELPQKEESDEAPKRRTSRKANTAKAEHDDVPF